MIVIQDEQLTRQLQQLAETEGRPVEAVLRALLSNYQPRPVPAPEAAESDDPVRRVRLKAYAKARAYWLDVGDAEKAALSDAELDEQFGVFDQEGIPRLKSEMTSLEPPPGSLAYAVKIAEQGPPITNNPYLARDSRAILDEHFAEDFLQRMRGADGTGQDSGG
jgi:hypothetical protein